MKRFLKITAFLLCFALLTGMAAGCAKETDPEKLVVAKVYGEAITRKEFDDYYASYVSNYAMYMYYMGMQFDESDEDMVTEAKNSALDELILQKILLSKAKEFGFDQLSQEKQEEKKKEVDDYIQEIKDGIRLDLEEEAAAAGETADGETADGETADGETADGETTDDETADGETAADETAAATVTDAQVQEKYEELLKENDITEEQLKSDLLESYLQQAVLGALEEHIKGNVTASDEDIQKWYDDNLKKQTEAIQASPGEYENYRDEGISLYVPEGIVKVFNLLIKVPDDKSETAQGLYEEGKTEEAFDVLRTSFENIQAKADEVLAKVKAGEDFAALMEEYGEDEGMTEEPQKTEGYTVVPENSQYYEEFTDAAVQLKNIGDTSGLVKTVYGYHILKKVGEVPSRTVPLSEVKDTIKETVLTEKQTSEWTAKMEEWKEAAKPHIEEDRKQLFV